MAFFSMAFSLGLCVLYITLSTGLIFFNKHLMHKDRFPHSMHLSALHMITTWSLCSLLFLLKPSLFPAMARTAGTRMRLAVWFVPVGACFAVSLFTANQAYLYCSPAFLQFMKETSIVTVFCMSSAVGLQVMTRAKAAILIWIIAGAAVAVTGEVHASLVGVVLQAVSQLGECTKNVMGEWLMSGQSFNLDPLTYTIIVAPVSLMVLLGGCVATWSHAVFVDFMIWWRVLVPNVLLAFTLNVTIAVLIKNCSAQTFVLAGLVKDMTIVFLSTCMMGEHLSGQEYVGFFVALVGVAFWSYHKMYPDAALTRLWKTLTCSAQEDLDAALEAKPILPASAKLPK